MLKLRHLFYDEYYVERMPDEVVGNRSMEERCGIRIVNVSEGSSATLYDARAPPEFSKICSIRFA